MDIQCIEQVRIWEEDGFTPEHFIKCDDMYGSILKIPELKEKAEEFGEKLSLRINTPKYDILGKGRQRLVEGGWKQYWNQDLADLLLSNKYASRLFELTGYDKDSWK